MNTLNSGTNVTNFLLYGMTMLGTFLTENWYLVIMVGFGLVHVYVVWQRNVRERELHDIKLAAARDDLVGR